MTVKEAATLRKGDLVMLTFDPRIYRVTRVKVRGSREVEVSFGKPVQRFFTAAAFRSLKRVLP